MTFINDIKNRPFSKLAGHTRTHEDTITRKFDLSFLNRKTISVFELEATSVIC